MNWTEHQFWLQWELLCFQHWSLITPYVSIRDILLIKQCKHQVLYFPHSRRKLSINMKLAWHSVPALHLPKCKLSNSFGTHCSTDQFIYQRHWSLVYSVTGYCCQCYIPPNFHFGSQLERYAGVAPAGPSHPTAPFCACVDGARRALQAAHICSSDPNFHPSTTA